MKDVSSASFKHSQTSWRNFKTRFKATNTKLSTYKSSSINWRKTNKSTVSKLLRPTPSITNALSKWSSKTIWSPNFKKRTLKQKEDSSNNKLSTRLWGPIEICILRICLKRKKKLLNWKWSLDEWLSRYLIWRKKLALKIKQLLRKKRVRRNIILKIKL